MEASEIFSKVLGEIDKFFYEPSNIELSKYSYEANFCK